jgi:hypothetical protein
MRTKLGDMRVPAGIGEHILFLIVYRAVLNPLTSLVSHVVST